MCKPKTTIWNFVGKIKADGSVEDEEESMMEAAVAHAMDDDKRKLGR